MTFFTCVAQFTVGLHEVLSQVISTCRSFFCSFLILLWFLPVYRIFWKSFLQNSLLDFFYKHFLLQISPVTFRASKRKHDSSFMSKSTGIIDFPRFSSKTRLHFFSQDVVGDMSTCINFPSVFHQFRTVRRNPDSSIMRKGAVVMIVLNVKIIFQKTVGFFLSRSCSM